MVMTDTIADMLTRIRNAIMVKKESVDVINSKINFQILAILKDKGYIKNFKHMKDTKGGLLRVYPAYDADGKPALRRLERVSTSGLRNYIRYKDIKPVRGGVGIEILSTPKGVITHEEAQKMNLGGEVLCRVW